MRRPNSRGRSWRRVTARWRSGQWCIGTHPTAPEGNAWLALLLKSPDEANIPGSSEWDARVAEHVEFGGAAGGHILGGAPLHPPTTATTGAMRNGNVSITDGPFAEGAEVANGFSVLSASNRAQAVKLASMILAGTVELRRLASVSEL